MQSLETIIKIALSLILQPVEVDVQESLNIHSNKRLNSEKQRRGPANIGRRCEKLMRDY